MPSEWAIKKARECYYQADAHGTTHEEVVASLASALDAAREEGARKMRERSAHLVQNDANSAEPSAIHGIGVMIAAIGIALGMSIVIVTAKWFDL